MRVFLALASALIAILVAGCKSGHAGLDGEWIARFGSQSLVLTLNSDHSFTMGSGSAEALGGKWRQSGGTVEFVVEALGGKDSDRALKEEVADGSKALKMSPSDIELETSKSAWTRMTMTLSSDQKTLTWTANGNTVFTRSGTESKGDLTDEAQIR